MVDGYTRSQLQQCQQYHAHKFNIYYFVGGMMEEFQKLWEGRLTGGMSQLVIDYDTFINHFGREVERQTNVILNDRQKEVIRATVDPGNKNLVYKNGYLLFVRDFWAVGSWRTKLFNMTINLSHLKLSTEPQPSLLATLNISIKYPNTHNIQTQTTYQFSQQGLINLTQHKKINIRNQGFLTIGYSQENEIEIDSIYMNKQHMKIIYSNEKDWSRFYVRDVSKSSRLEYVIDRPEKYVKVNQGMMVSFGMVAGVYRIRVEGMSAGEPPGRSLEEVLNADRISYVVGVPDQPYRTVMEVEKGQVNEATIADLYDRNLFYPVPPKPTKKSSQKAYWIKLSVQNLRTLQKKVYDFQNRREVVVGRHVGCDIVVEDVSVSEKQCMFQCLNDVWVVRRAAETNIGVLLAQNSCHSNRTELSHRYPSTYTIHSQIQITLTLTRHQNDLQQ